VEPEKVFETKQNSKSSYKKFLLQMSLKVILLVLKQKVQMF